MTSDSEKQFKELLAEEQKATLWARRGAKINIGTWLTIIGMASGAVWWAAGAAERLEGLEEKERAGTPRSGATQRFDRVDGRLDKLERGQDVLREKARTAERDRRRIINKLDRIIDNQRRSTR